MAGNVGKKANLTPKQFKYLELLAAGERPVEAAPAVGISLRTAQQWEADPTFQEALQRELDRCKEEVREKLREKLRALAPKALEVLPRPWDDSDLAARVRRSAAKDILRFAGHRFAQKRTPEEDSRNAGLQDRARGLPVAARTERGGDRGGPGGETGDGLPLSE